MTFDEIMQEITAGLTGEQEHDILYLQAQGEKYATHEMAQEILRACGRLLYKILPDEQKEAFARTIENNNLGYESVLEEVRFKVHQQKFEEALPLMEGLIKKIETSHLFADDSVNEYHCFSEPFEELLYTFYNKPQKAVRYASFPYDEIYLQYGSLLIDLKRIQDARDALSKAMRWNPANAYIAFEHAETYKLLGDIDSFFHLTVMIFAYAFRPEHVARCYRNLGYYFVEKKRWREANSCYALSLRFENDSKNAMSELYFIRQKVGDVGQLDLEEMKALAEEYGFPFGAQDDVLGLSYTYGKNALDKQQYDAARYFLTITWSLTNDEEIKKLIDAIPAGDGQGETT